MFFTNLDVKRYEERRNGMQAREKEGLWELLRPLMGERRHYLSRIDILNDVRAGQPAAAAASRDADGRGGIERGEPGATGAAHGARLPQSGVPAEQLGKGHGVRLPQAGDGAARQMRRKRAWPKAYSRS